MATLRNPVLEEVGGGKKNLTWWPKPVIPILERWRQVDSELGDSLGKTLWRMKRQSLVQKSIGVWS